MNAAFSEDEIEVRDGLAFAPGEDSVYCDTNGSDPTSKIGWDGNRFSVLNNSDEHTRSLTSGGLERSPTAITSASWRDMKACYDLTTLTCDFSKNGYRLPTEAEWEYAARGGQYYHVFPWGDNENDDGTFANWPNSGDPYEGGGLSRDNSGSVSTMDLCTKRQLSIGPETKHPTRPPMEAMPTVFTTCPEMSGSGAMTGIVAITTRKALPTTQPVRFAGDPMPDGNPYHVLRGGNWFNGEDYWGHGRVANRNPAYYRGPDDPNHAWYHVGFRVVLKATSESVVESGASLDELATGLQFAEGPAADAEGNVFFSDVLANTIYKWSMDNQLSTFRENSGGANGLFFDLRWQFVDM